MSHPMPDDVPVIDTAAPELVVDEPSGTGEGPLWNEDERALYWVDIPTGRLFRYSPATDTNELAYQHDSMIGGYTFQADGAILLFGMRGQILRWNAGAVETVVSDIERERDGRFNDVIADPEGRVFCGTMPTDDHLARLYRLDLDGSLTEVFDDIGLSNGLGFSPDNRVMYHTDSNNRRISRLDYDAASGELTKRATLIETPDDGSVPDGMAVDAEGTIWSARWDGHALYRYGADGQSLGKVPFPVRKVSSVTFAGDDYTTAYVTTAGGGNRGDAEGATAGSLYRVNLGVRGRPPFRSRIGLA